MSRIIVKARHVVHCEGERTNEEGPMDEEESLLQCMKRTAHRITLPSLLALYAQSRIDDPNHRILCTSDKQMQDEVQAFKRIIFLMGYVNGHGIHTDIPVKHGLNVGTLIMNRPITMIRNSPEAIREGRKKRKESKSRKRRIVREHMLRAAVLEELMEQIQVVFPARMHISNQH